MSREQIGGRIVTDGLVLMLDAGNEKSYPGTGTTWSDLSGNGYDSTLVGTVNYSTTYGGVLSVDGNQTSSYILFNTNSLSSISTSQIWSLESVIRLDSVLGSTYFHSMATSVDNNFYIVQKNNNTVFAWNETRLSGTDMTFTAGETFVLTIVHESGVQSYYKNGEFKASYAAANNIENAEGWVLNQEQDSVIGGFDPAQATDMGVYIVRLYDKSLTADEVSQNFNATRNRFGI